MEPFVYGLRLKTCVSHNHITETRNTDLPIHTYTIRHMNQDHATQVEIRRIHETIMKRCLSYISDRQKTTVPMLKTWEVQTTTMKTGRLELQTSASMI